MICVILEIVLYWTYIVILTCYILYQSWAQCKFKNVTDRTEDFFFVIQDEHPGPSSVSDFTSCESLDEALMNIVMEEHLRILQKEQMDMESLVCFSILLIYLFN